VKVPKPTLGNLAIWITAIITALAAPLALVDPEFIGVTATGAAAFIGAGVVQANNAVPA
jgi:hypothetical protein